MIQIPQNANGFQVQPRCIPDEMDQILEGLDGVIAIHDDIYSLWSR